MKTYQSRREYVSSIFGPLADCVRGGANANANRPAWNAPIGLYRRVANASRPQKEDFQGVGLLCREALITLGQVVWIAERHPPIDGVVPSEADAKRRWGAYTAVSWGPTPTTRLANTQRPR